MHFIQRIFGRRTAPAPQLALVPHSQSLLVRLYVDCSTSMTHYADQVPAAIEKMMQELKELAQQLSVDLGSVFVSTVAFNGQRVEVQPVTPIAHLRPWTVDDYKRHRGNGSKVRDTVVGGIRSVREQALHLAQQGLEVLPAVVVISDGHDFGSEHSIAETSGIVTQARADGINVILNYLGVDAAAARREAEGMGLDVGYTLVAKKGPGELEHTLTQAVQRLEGGRTFIGRV